MHILFGIELRWWNSRNTKFHNQKPRQFEISRTLGNMWWKIVVLGEIHLGEVCKDKVAAFRVRVL